MRSAALALLLLALPAIAETITGRVVGIADGDTLTLLDGVNRQHKIRLAGIDAPEKAQPFGERSKANLSRLAFDKTVSAQCTKRDRYRREICVILDGGGRDVNLEQIASGMAWWYRQYAREQTPQQRQDYEAAEFNAQARRLGLWSDKNPTPPWDWRHRK